VVIDDGVNNSFSRIDGVVVVLVVRRIDGVVVRNDKTDPDGPDDLDGNVAAAAVDCAAVESKGGEVAELARNN
jgi:hypothetical protein